MMRETYGELSEPAAWTVSRLQQWCQEWVLDRAMREGDGVEGVVPGHGGTAGMGPGVMARPAAGLRAGTVALLAPREPEIRPLFVMLLTVAAAGGELCVPFGRFTVPATPGELLSGRRADALRVLSLWNARRAGAGGELRGWVLEEVSSEEARRVGEAWERVVRTGALPRELVEAGGPPLTHPDDPRRRYLHEARMRVDRGLGVWEGRGRSCPYEIRYPEVDQLPRAAEGQEPYGE